jgi:hypothetical protein
VEKSPPNILKTLFLARAFNPAPTSFVMMLRHPFATAAHFIFNTHSMDERMSGKQAPTNFHDLDCGERFLKHWLLQMKLFRSDLALIPRSVNVSVVRRVFFCGCFCFCFLHLLLRIYNFFAVLFSAQLVFDF